MHDQDMSIIKALVPVAWADGVFADRERNMIDALLDAYEATDAEREIVHEYAETKRTLDDIELQDLSAGDRRVLVLHAVLLTFVDGVQTPSERALLDALTEKLKISREEAARLLHSGAERAKRHLGA